ncbi:MAG: non-ribosomal peptide synthetase, partial [Algicola sp.]|nr:non-ribosomal peptide synthetase [Algicola sp.]
DNALQAQLCEIWQVVLGLAQVGIEDNFFRIGGDSIVSIQLVSRLRQAGFELQVKAIFDAPTVAQLARVLADNKAADKVKITAEQGLLSGTFDLLPIQQWFFEQPLVAPQHWNQAFMMAIAGDISPTQIEQALTALAARHDMLRCCFDKTDQGWSQSYHQSAQPGMAELRTLNVEGLDEPTLQQTLTQWQSGFDYCHGPLWQAGLLSGYADGSARLFFAFHHLIIDTVSWRIIAEDIKQLLCGEALAAKTSSYRQWVAAVQHYARANEDQKVYWLNVVAGLPTLPEPTVLTQHQVQLAKGQTERLLRQANLGYHTEINDLLLSALAMALKSCFGQAVNGVTLEGHGREAIDDTLDTSRTLGWFTTSYPVRLCAFEQISETIIQTKQMLRAIPDKGIGFGALNRAGNGAGQLTAELTPISFNYLGQLGSSDSNEWALVAERSGQTSSPDNSDNQLLNINGAVQSGLLQFAVASRLGHDNSKQFVAAFEAALVAVIEQACLTAEKGGVKTPADYAGEISITHLQNLQARFGDNTIEALYPASSLQQGFVYHHLSQPLDDAYRVQILLDYQQGLDLDVYCRAWQLTSLRYPVLRMGFDWQGQILQVFGTEQSLTAEHFNIIDINHLSSQEREQAIAKIQQQDRAKGFDLSQPGLLRFNLIKQHAAMVTVMMTTHHSISDGWSGPLLLQTVHQYYDSLLAEQAPTVVAETAYLEAQHWVLAHHQETAAFWTQMKSGYGSANDINAMLSEPQDLTRLTVVTQPAEQVLTLAGDDYQALKAMCRSQGVTLNVALQFAWHKLLHSYTADEQTIVGTTVSGRDIPVNGIESSVGLYINTLPLAVDWHENSATGLMLQQIQQQIAALNSHSSVSLASLQHDGERLFHSLFVFENYPEPIGNGKDPAGIEGQVSFRQAVEKTDYPLSL